MKKVLSISLLSVYLIFSSGIHLEIDKCCGRIASLLGMELEKPTDTCCSSHSCCAPGEKDGEKHNECDLVDVNLFIESEQNVPTTVNFPFLADLPLEKTKDYSKDQFFIEDSNNECYRNSDPPDSVPIYIIQNSLVLYG